MNSRPIGWRWESRRHYLAAKGIKTKYQEKFPNLVKDFPGENPRITENYARFRQESPKKFEGSSFRTKHEGDNEVVLAQEKKSGKYKVQSVLVNRADYWADKLDFFRWQREHPNVMTPDVIKLHQVDDDTFVEVSEGRGFDEKPFFGVSVVHAKEAGKFDTDHTDVNRPFRDKNSALLYAEGLVNDLRGKDHMASKEHYGTFDGSQDSLKEGTTLTPEELAKYNRKIYVADKEKDPLSGMWIIGTKGGKI